MKFEVPQPDHTARVATWLYLRGLAVVFAVAFASLGGQIQGLVGTQGILPARDFLEAVGEHMGLERLILLPTLFWAHCSDATLVAACWSGVALSVLLFFNLAPALLCLLLSLLYLSLVCVGQTFLSFQWDGLLVEAGFLAVFLAPWKLYVRWTALPRPPWFAVFLTRWLLFRFMLLCGLVKLLSGDVTWLNLSALSYHYETQPLPSPLAWFLHNAPLWTQQASAATMFLLELMVPFFIWGGRWWRRTAFVFLVGLQVLILLSGNHAFFNWLVIVLCLPLLDDSLFAQWMPDRLGSLLSREMPMVPLSPSKNLCLYGIGGILFLASLLVSLQQVLRSELVPGWLRPLTAVVANWRAANGYGVFAVMTTSRPEIILEGSRDGQVWEAYELPFKPGDLARSPMWNAPHQPRLDWQLWFAALTGYERSVWVQNVLVRLLQGADPVERLFRFNPFPDHPPLFVRATLYEYHFTTPEERAATGRWWKRDYVGSYSPTLTLQAHGR